MTEWNPKDEMNSISYIWFKLGFYVEVDTIPQWVRDASDPPRNISPSESAEAIFNGRSLEYKVVTDVMQSRGAPRSTTVSASEYYVRIQSGVLRRLWHHIS